MPDRNNVASAVARKIRKVLSDGGSGEHAAGVQWFFKEEIKSHGWCTGDLRRAMRRCRREILQEHDLDFLLTVADELFDGTVLEEKIAGVFLLEQLDAQFGDREFRMFESWLDRISSWADHDALVHDLIAPMVIAGAGQPCVSLGEVAPSLAPPRGLRGADSRGAGENILPRDRKTFGLAARRPRRHGTEGPGLVAAGNGKGRPGTHRAISDEDSGTGSATGVADRL
jgi:DNA alkylation repair enzyme